MRVWRPNTSRRPLSTFHRRSDSQDYFYKICRQRMGPTVPERNTLERAATRGEPVAAKRFLTGRVLTYIMAQVQHLLPANGCHRPQSTSHAKQYSNPIAISINYPFGADENSLGSAGGLISNLPPQSVQDTFVSHYRDTVESAYHIIDTEFLMNELQEFRSQKFIAQDDLLAQYFMVLALGCQVHNFTAKATGSQAYPLLPYDLLHGAELFLKRTPFLFRPTLPNIRTICLMIISKQMYAMSCHESDTCWPLTGMALRLSIRMGLHVIPAHATEPMSQKSRMARRLWATVVFLEMGQSLICGMPLLLPPSDTACVLAARPLRDSGLLDVEDQDPDEITPEPSRLEATFGQSTELLMKSIELATMAEDQVSYTQVVDVDTALRSHLKRRDASPIGLHFATEKLAGSPVDLEAAMLDIFFRQTIMALHARFAMQPMSWAKFPVSYISSLESALAMLSHQRILCEGEPRARQSSWFAGLFRHEFFAAAMTVCCQLMRSSQAPGVPSADGCDGQAKEIMLDALRSCRDVWSQEKQASVCNAEAFALVDKLVCMLGEL